MPNFLKYYSIPRVEPRGAVVSKHNFNQFNMFCRIVPYRIFSIKIWDHRPANDPRIQSLRGVLFTWPCRTVLFFVFGHVVPQPNPMTYLLHLFLFLVPPHHPFTKSTTTTKSHHTSTLSPFSFYVSERKD